MVVPPMTKVQNCLHFEQAIVCRYALRWRYASYNYTIKLCRTSWSLIFVISLFTYNNFDSGHTQNYSETYKNVTNLQSRPWFILYLKQSLPKFDSHSNQMKNKSNLFAIYTVHRVFLSAYLPKTSSNKQNVI